MQISIKLPFFIFLTCLLLCFTAQAYAVPSFTISSSDNGVFVLQGTDLQVIGGAKITIRYDTSTLTNPRVTQGRLASGAIFLPNTATQGIIRMGLVALNGISGSGTVASIAFDRVGSSPGVIQKLDAEVIDLNSEPVAAQVRVINPAELPSSSLTEAASAAAATASNASSATPGQSTASTVTQQLQPQMRAGTVGGLPAQPQNDGITAPPSGSDRVGETTPAEQPDVATASLPVPETRISIPTNLLQEAPAGKPVKKIQPDHVAYKSVLEQFRAVAGLKKTPRELTEIFTRHTMPGIKQEPAVAVSDGTSKLHLSITLNSPATKAPNFSLKHATLISLRTEGDSSWLIEVLPAKGVCSATLTMLLNDSETEIPLLVAPPLPGGTGPGREGKLTDADFTRFLTERGTDKDPRFDLNGDGKRDYIDDYIFTANYYFGKDM